MVEWTNFERAAIKSLWMKIDVKEMGAQALARLLIVYPWTQRYLASCGNLSTSSAILGNKKVAELGFKVMAELDKAVKNMDNIKNIYTELSVMHSEKLHVDPENFRLLAECITLCVGAKFGPSVFTVRAQEAWHKFLSVVVAALSKQYH